jgi:predicted nucleotidyltransferase
MISTMKTAVSEKLEEICRRHGVSSLFAFGSRGAEIAGMVRGHEVPPGPASSDLDLGVLLPRSGEPAAFSAVRFTAELEDLFGVPRVDLVVLGRASALLAVEAIKGELLVDLAGRETAEFELFALRRAADLLPHQRARVDAVLREGAR